MANALDYVRQYAPALNALLNPQVQSQPMGPIAQSMDIFQQQAPALQGVPAEAPQPAIAPVARAPKKPALAPAPAAAGPSAETGKGTGFWDVTKDLSDDDKDQIVGQFEKQGVDVEAEFSKLQEQGEVDAGLIKRGKDGKIDKRDLGLFLLEFGLRTMSADPRKGWGAVGEGAMGAIEGRRTRARGALADKAANLESIDRKQTAAQAETTRLSERKQDQTIRAGEQKDDRQFRSDQLDKELKSRERQARIDARQRGDSFYIDEEGSRRNVTSNRVVTDPDTGAPIKQKLPGSVPADKQELTASDRVRLRTDIAKAVNEDYRIPQGKKSEEIERQYQEALKSVGAGLTMDFADLKD